MSVESIVEKIRSDGHAEAENLLAAGRKKADEIESGAKQSAEKLRRETEADVQKRAESIADRYAAAARLDVKKIRLAARKQAVEEVYALAKKRLRELNEEETLRLFNRLLCAYAEEGDKVIFADGFAYEKAVVLLPVFAKKNLTVLSDGQKSVNIDGGMYLVGKAADKDLSFDALLKADLAENESDVASFLFGKNG
ncbi:MAG: V-type ATP synthase subunit E [Candidatus Scatosoma sp.]